MGQQHPYAGRALELELIRVRAEAAAVRLEARAAEIELLLISHATAGGATAGGAMAGGAMAGGAMAGGAMAGGDGPEDSAALTGPWEGIADRWQPDQRAPAGEAAVESCTRGRDDAPQGTAAESSPGVRLDAAEALVMAIRQLVSAHQQRSVAGDPQPGDNQPAPQHNGDWQTRLETLRRRTAEDGQSAQSGSPGATSAMATSAMATSPVATSPVAAALTAELRPALPAEHRGAATVGQAPEGPLSESGDGDGPATLGEARLLRFDEPAESIGRPQRRQRRVADQRHSAARSAPSAAADIVASLDGQPARSITAPSEQLPAGAVCLQPPDAMPRRRRLRPGGWLASTLAHLVVLVLLALMTLSAQKPRDQLAFTASASEASQDEMETFTIQTPASVPEEANPQPTETALEISDVGTLPVTEVSLDLAAAPPGIAADLFSTRAGSMNTLAEASAKGDSPTKVQFAGVDGGGNHFVYLVDSSNSMRNFNEARLELLRSVDSLQVDQRFYVAFYDANPDFMRLSDAATDQPTSVFATPANKLALRRWAMTIQQERGKSPIDVLPFAFGLRPDVVFLLSDGEFSARTEQVIGEHNRRSNLFGEQGPISIIHTIRYPGYSAEEARSAEVQMRRIAAENGGQYRNVVIP